MEGAQNLYLTIDRELQQYGEELQNKRGGIVAIEPKLERYFLWSQHPAMIQIYWVENDPKIFENWYWTLWQNPYSTEVFRHNTLPDHLLKRSMHLLHCKRESLIRRRHTCVKKVTSTLVECLWNVIADLEP